MQRCQSDDCWRSSRSSVASRRAFERTRASMKAMPCGLMGSMRPRPSSPPTGRASWKTQATEPRERSSEATLSRTSDQKPLDEGAGLVGQVSGQQEHGYEDELALVPVLACFRLGHLSERGHAGQGFYRPGDICTKRKWGLRHRMLRNRQFPSCSSVVLDGLVRRTGDRLFSDDCRAALHCGVSRLRKLPCGHGGH